MSDSSSEGAVMPAAQNNVPDRIMMLAGINTIVIIVVLLVLWLVVIPRLERIETKCGDGFSIYTDRNYTDLVHKYRSVPSSTGFDRDVHAPANQHIGESRGPPMRIRDRYEEGFTGGASAEGFEGGCGCSAMADGFSGSSEAFITKVVEAEARRGVKPAAFGALEAPTDIHNVKGAAPEHVFSEHNLMNIA